MAAGLPWGNGGTGAEQRGGIPEQGPRILTGASHGGWPFVWAAGPAYPKQASKQASTALESRVQKERDRG